MASVENKQLLKKTTAKIWRLVSSLPIYAVGEERQLLIGLLQRKEWINILNDVPVNTKHVFSKTLLGEKVRFSVFPFKVALNHDIPILFIGVTRVRHHYHITIEPIADFSTEEEGLKQYLVAIENMLDRDPFTAFGIAESFVSPL